MHVLYRLFDASDDLLYIGKTVAPSSRFQQHRETKSWWRTVATIRLAYFNSAEELDREERYAIRSERPLHNIKHNKHSGYGYREVAPLSYDITDGGYPIAVVFCPYCECEHPHHYGEVLVKAPCGRGRYRIQEEN